MTQEELKEVIRKAKEEKTKALGLSDEGLTELPPEIGSLTALQMLSLNRNPLTALPPEIGSLTALVWLDLNGNQLTELAPEIGSLTALQMLNLGGNRLTELPPEIGSLTALKSLWLNGNQLTELPPEIGSLRNLRNLEPDGNPLRFPSPDIVEQGTHSIVAYCASCQKDATERWESKLLFVGEGGAGKTCLRRALLNLEFDSDSETTHGVEVGDLVLQHPAQPSIEMLLKWWDFGGQEVYHATHQFFLSSRALYVLVWNARLDFKQANLYYWLDTIENLAPDCPVFLVATHIDQRTPRLPLDDLKAKYPSIGGSFAVSNSTGEGIQDLRKSMAEAAAGLPLMGEKWPTSWLEAAGEIGSLDEKWIPAQRLERIFKKHGLDEGGQKVLARWLHELGYVIHFQDDPDLGEIVLLDSEWTTKTISKALTDSEIESNHGVFRRERIGVVWEELDLALRERFLKLMHRFDLSYEIPGDPEDKSLVVELLPLDPPDLGDWESALKREDCKEVAMRFDLDSTRPAGIPTWFIAREHRFTTHTHWRFGALFADKPKGRHLALIRTGPEDRFIDLAVRGPTPWSFFGLMKDGFEELLTRFEGLKVQRLVACRCRDETGESPCSHSYPFDHLERFRHRDPPISEVPCPVSLEVVSIDRMLFGIHPVEHDKVVERIESMLAEMRDASGQRHAELTTQLGAMREMLQREFTRQFRRDQRLEESACPSVFTLRPVEGKSWSDKWLHESMSLQLYCEHPGHWHPVEGGRYTIKKPKDSVDSWMPQAKRLAELLPVALRVASGADPSMKTAAGLSHELVKRLPELEREAESIAAARLRRDPEEASGASLRSLRELLVKLDKDHYWGGLSKTHTPEGDILWLCDSHVSEYE